MYVILAVALAAFLVLDVITPEQVGEAADQALLIAEAIAKALAALAMVLARLNLTPDPSQ